jgi:hypothetical protein
MSHTFKTIPGRPAFSVFNEPADAGEYINSKKAKAMFCSANNCNSSGTFSSYSNLFLLKKSNNLQYYPCANNVDPTNLNVNLITKLNLTNINVIQPVDVSLNVIPFLYYDIDPSGQLFGNTTCGINNYLNYLEYDYKCKNILPSG